LAQHIPMDPDKGVTDLVRQLGDDSKRLLTDEMRLAKLEAAESVHAAGRGAMWLGLAFGIVIVALVAFTLAFASFFGRVANGHYWIGAMLTAALEIAAGLWLVQKGLAAFTPYRGFFLRSRPRWNPTDA
jgi:putative superfamily III holin-X